MDGDDGDGNGNGPELALLLPFYVNGTLSAEQRGRVEAALAADPELRVELKAAREIADLVRSGGSSLAPQAVSPDRLNALLSRIGEQSGPSPATRALPRRILPRLRAGGGHPTSRAPQAIWKPAFAAAAALLVIQSAVIAYWRPARTDYASLSGPSAPAPAGRLLVRISPDARWADVEALLSSRDLTIVGGPRGAVIDLAVGTGARLEEEARRLRASPLVEFVGVAS